MQCRLSAIRRGARDLPAVNQGKYEEGKEEKRRKWERVGARINTQGRRARAHLQFLEILQPQSVRRCSSSWKFEGQKTGKSGSRLPFEGLEVPALLSHGVCSSFISRSHVSTSSAAGFLIRHAPLQASHEPVGAPRRAAPPQNGIVQVLSGVSLVIRGLSDLPKLGPFRRGVGRRLVHVGMSLSWLDCFICDVLAGSAARQSHTGRLFPPCIGWIASQVPVVTQDFARGFLAPPAPTRADSVRQLGTDSLFPVFVTDFFPIQKATMA